MKVPMMNVVDEDLLVLEDKGLPVEALVAIAVVHDEERKRVATAKKRRRAGNEKRDRNYALQEIVKWSNCSVLRSVST